INEDALPELYYPEPKINTGEKNKRFFEGILGIGTMSYSDLCEKVMEKASIKIDGAKKKIARAKDEGIISKTNSGYYCIPFENENQDELPF
ncbi:MAG: hypothetical protein LBS20_03935, partial [Prevotella sp.]|nr:hypothetical protein [Prevotella sp.]